ncbi:MAG: 2-phosphosulfolactate phosphatase, partial [Sphaerochaetaceae bacterium]|nr:2-phosphosulfolactate phosphatase [Sphaerochaetaceae bacterium]
IIDVFRAFTVQCFLYERKVSKIFSVGKVEDCLELQKKYPHYIYVGERQGIKIQGFDLGNSPSGVATYATLEGKTIVHTTSAGVQGIVNAKNASEIITGSLVNAKAVASYIKMKNPEYVSLVPMGLNGTEDSAEDEICASYIKALLLGENPNIHNEIASLKESAGKKFFDPQKREHFPMPDFFMCLVPNIFNFVIKANTTGPYIEMEKIEL